MRNKNDSRVRISVNLLWDNYVNLFGFIKENEEFGMPITLTRAINAVIRAAFDAPKGTLQITQDELKFNKRKNKKIVNLLARKYEKANSKEVKSTKKGPSEEELRLLAEAEEAGG